MKYISKLVVLATLFVFVLQSYTFGVESSLSVKDTSNLMQVKILDKQVGNDSIYEKGIAYLPNKEIVYEQNTVGDETTLKLTYDNVVEEAVYSEKSDIITVSINGVTETFNKNDYITKVEPNNNLLMATTTTYSNPSVYGVNVGTNYIAKELMRQNFTFRYFTETARLLEDYEWIRDDFSIFDFSATTYVSVIIGVLGISFSTAVSILGSLIALKDGVNIITEAISGEVSELTQYWNKYGKIIGDTDCDSHYHAGKTMRWKLVSVEDTGSYESELLQNSTSGNFNNNSSIMQSIINAYIAVHTYL